MDRAVDPAMGSGSAERIQDPPGRGSTARALSVLGSPGRKPEGRSIAPRALECTTARTAYSVVVEVELLSQCTAIADDAFSPETTLARPISKPRSNDCRRRALPARLVSSSR